MIPAADSMIPEARGMNHAAPAMIPEACGMNHEAAGMNHAS